MDNLKEFIIQISKLMKVIKLFLCFFLIVLQISCSKKNSATLSVETENSTEYTNDFKVCESDGGFEIAIDETFRNKIFEKKAKKIVLMGNDKKIEISLFNIFYSSKNDVEYQSPLTPKGSVSIFKDGNCYFIDVKSKDKSGIKELLKGEINKCSE